MKIKISRIAREFWIWLCLCQIVFFNSWNVVLLILGISTIRKKVDRSNSIHIVSIANHGFFLIYDSKFIFGWSSTKNFLCTRKCNDAVFFFCLCQCETKTTSVSSDAPKWRKLLYLSEIFVVFRKQHSISPIELFHRLSVSCKRCNTESHTFSTHIFHSVKYELVDWIEVKWLFAIVCNDIYVSMVSFLFLSSRFVIVEWPLIWLEPL